MVQDCRPAGNKLANKRPRLDLTAMEWTWLDWTRLEHWRWRLVCGLVEVIG